MHYDKDMTTTKSRTDIHRPSSEAFEPDSYEFVACGDNNPEDGYSPDLRFLREQGITKWPGASRDICSHCGSHLRYYAIMVHVPTREWIVVGETCYDGRFDAGLSGAEFQKLRKAAQLNRERKAKALRVKSILAEYPFLAELLEAAKAEDLGEFLDSIATNLQANGELSDRQLDAAERAWIGHKKYVAKIAASEAQKAAEIASGAMKPAPTGRQIIQGTVLSLKDVEDNYSYFGGTIRKALVETTDLFKVWMTVPASISDIETGEKIQVTITLKPSDTDKYFSIGTRPSKATRI